MIEWFLTAYVGFAGLLIGYLYNEMKHDEAAVKKSMRDIFESRLSWLESGTTAMNARLGDLESKRPTYIYALDPSINRRVVHVITDGYAVSMVTGHKFPFGPEDYDGMVKRFESNKGRGCGMVCYWCGTPYYKKYDLLIPNCGCTPIRQRGPHDKRGDEVK
jgi:hypothetical protein